MTEPKTRPTAASVADFLAAVPDATRRSDAQAVQRLMQQATGEPACLWGSNIVGFGRYRQGAGARATDWPLVAFSPRKTELVLYLMPGFEVQTARLARLGRHRTGKSCLYIKRLADVDSAVLSELIDDAVAGMAATRVHPASDLKAATE